MSNTELLEYKRYLQKYVFAGWEAPDDLKEWVRLLERHIMHSDLMEEQLPEGFPPTSNTGPGEALSGGEHATSALVCPSLPGQVSHISMCFISVSECTDLFSWC